jgi:hypothetical protein
LAATVDVDLRQYLRRDGRAFGASVHHHDLKF